MALRIILVVLFITLAGSAYGQKSVDVILGGYNQVPVVRTTGMGITTATLHGDTLTVKGTFSDLIGNYRSAYIHHGARDRMGHRMFRLTVEVGEDNKSGVIRAENNQFILTDSQRNAVRRGLMYINITSDRNRQGEIRGQITRL